MAEKGRVYKCEICGNIVQVFHGGQGKLVCCGENMVLLEEQTADSTTEKHVPVIEPADGGVLVKVGSVPHPMMDKHYIEWIEVVDGDKVYRQHLNPNDEPQAFFPLSGDHLIAREYCNLHGHWKA